MASVWRYGRLVAPQKQQGRMILLSSDTYPQARAGIRSGDLLAWRGTGLIGRLVRHWTGESWSHVGIAWVISGRVLVLEARDGRGVVAVPLSERLDCYHLPTGAVWDEAMQARALDHLGGRYSVTDAIRAGLGLRPRESGWQCAEYAAHVLGLSGRVKGFTPGLVVEAVVGRT